ncbi:MAG: GAF sensor-containing diguanylate cyclase [Anaerolineaceae bacterium]|nr:MAG: GAF sensor-containing diguanylate cyclase [Anaerolineaceae bacterium]
MDIPELLDKVRDHLEENDIPAENREFIIELLDVLMTPAEGYSNVALTSDTIQRLADALINNNNILAALRRQSAELDALKRITLNLTASLELQAVLDAIVREALHLVSDAQDAHIFLYQDGKLSFGASLFAGGKKNVPFAEPRPEGLTYTVARQKQVIIAEDMHNHPLYAGHSRKWAGSIIGIPLLMGDRVVGVMNLARTQAGDFSHPEVRLLTLLADQAAIAITNARLHEAVKGQALNDVLTGLPNRRALDERLDTEIKRATRTGLSFAVIMMDIDGFKVINDNYGHDVGDDVLRQVAQALLQALRATDLLARYGGDELTLILPDTGWPDAETVITKIQDQITNLDINLPDGTTTHLGVSGGVAIFPRHANTAPNLLRAADEALYRAKRHQRGSFQLAQRGTGQLPNVK